MSNSRWVKSPRKRQFAIGWLIQIPLGSPTCDRPPDAIPPGIADLQSAS
ncbi:MAG: hypothetical protein ACO34J_15160 [Prochlorothrix sp.]